MAGSDLQVEFVCLSDIPDLVNACAAFHAKLAGDDSEDGLAMRKAAFQRLALDGEEEDAVIALNPSNREIVGLAALLKSELDAFEELGPWLAGLIVSPSDAEHGLSDKIRAETEALADELGYAHICVQTDVPSMYSAKGYQEIDSFERDGQHRVVMGKTL